MSLVYLYNRYDIAKNRLPKKKWWSNWLICYDCAKRVGITYLYTASDLRTMYDKDYPGCEACGKQDELAEVKVSYKICQKLRKMDKRSIKLEDVLKI